jgi:hypothetical protein
MHHVAIGDQIEVGLRHMDSREQLKNTMDHLPGKVGAPARPFWAKREDQESSPNHWRTATIHIFHAETKIGSYERNYPSFGEMTFEPFELNGRWYALYSRDYTATRLMSLPDCRDLGGEEPSSGGFCPVEFFVPRYRQLSMKNMTGGDIRESWHFESKGESLKEEDTPAWQCKVGPWQCLKVGFVAGCVWGDDSSWKLEMIDLSSAAEGNVRRDARFGHFEIAAGLPLAAAVQLHRDLPSPMRATLFREECRDIESGKRIDPYSDELVE